MKVRFATIFMTKTRDEWARPHPRGLKFDSQRVGVHRVQLNTTAHTIGRIAAQRSFIHAETLRNGTAGENATAGGILTKPESFWYDETPCGRHFVR